MTEPTREQAEEAEAGNPEVPAAPEPRWRPAAEPTCCGSGCDDCPF
ncbi:MAG: hypothetical protein WA208_06005 [Thermoanaerobaculia bacterium]